MQRHLIDVWATAGKHSHYQRSPGTGAADGTAVGDIGVARQ
jgi:hypothetical protein